MRHNFLVMEDKEIINFYSVSENPYGVFSNFAPYPINIEKKVWPTSEHYFQAKKFEEKTYQEKIRKADGPMEAAQLGRSRKVKIKKKWDYQRDNVMYEAVYAKFTQHLDLQKLLLETGDAILVEHTENDRYWGDGGDGSGQNKLGKTLMKIRERLIEENS